MSLCELEIDPINVMHAMLCVEWAMVVNNLPEIFDIVKTKGIAIYMNSTLNIVETHMNLSSHASYPTFRAVRGGPFLYLEIESGTPKHNNSFIGCLHRYE